MAKKTTELVLLFHKKTTKLVFLWPNMSQNIIKVFWVMSKIWTSKNKVFIFNQSSISELILTPSHIYLYIAHINTLMLFWPILGQRKTSLVVFLWKMRSSLVVFLATILFLIAYITPLEIILWPKWQWQLNSFSFFIKKYN